MYRTEIKKILKMQIKIVNTAIEILHRTKEGISIEQAIQAIHETLDPLDSLQIQEILKSYFRTLAIYINPS